MKKKLLIGLASLVGLFVLFYAIMFRIIGWELPPTELKVSNLTVRSAEVESSDIVTITVSQHH